MLKSSLLSILFEDLTRMIEMHLVREPVILLNKWLRPKGLKACSYEEKYAEFKNQTLKNIGWYTKMLCAAEYRWGRQFLKLALKWGTLNHRIEFDLSYTPMQFFIGAKLFLGTP